ncbi:hematopoietic prostaglandin D synthase isoform 3-T3 [Cyanocitta cristata]
MGGEEACRRSRGGSGLHIKTRARAHQPFPSEVGVGTQRDSCAPRKGPRITAPTGPSMPQYKLTYFNLRGRAEISRYLFAYSGKEYEDHRIEAADWPKIKPTIPFGKLPILEVDGVIIHQSLAMARYLARESGLAGRTPVEQALADAIVDTIDDFMTLFPWAEKNQDVRVTWADFYWDVCSTTLLSCKPDLADKYPRLLALRERVQALPAIAAWIQKRPKSVM